MRDVILDHIHDAVFATDPSNRVTFWSPSAERLFGYSAAEAVGRLVGEILPYQMADPDDEAVFFAALRAGNTWRGTGTVRLRDSSEMWIESTVEPIIAGGSVIGSVSVSRDITATVEAQRALAAHRQFVDAILDVAGVHIVVLDRAGRIVRFNGASERLSGYNQDEAQGLFFWDLIVPPTEVAATRAAFDALCGGDFPGTLESHWVTRSGLQRLIAWSNTCLTDEQGEVTHVIATGIDVTDERRLADALQGLDTVGRLLAAQGPTRESLQAVVDDLAVRMGYQFVAIHLLEGRALRMGAQRGYPPSFDSLDVSGGVIGRVARTGTPEIVADVAADPDYLVGDPAVTSEIAVPLIADRRTLGVLDIESTASVPLSDRDLGLASAVADQLASALLLGREQLAQRERARMFASLTDFAAAANAVLEAGQLSATLVSAVADVVPGNMIMLTLLDRATGRYLVRGVSGIDLSAIGREVRPGDGVTGRAILSRAEVVVDFLRRPGFASSVRDLVPFDVESLIAVPLIREGAVLGAITIGRAPDAGGFSELEREALSLLGTQAALAVANANLVEEVSELAIHDGLTGLYNRRHFDAALDHLLARRLRQARARPVAAIMFDLDHFGRFNRDHGHLAGDEVLRTFARILRERLRSSDLVARYGGEEFIAILDECQLEDAVVLADDVRRSFEARVIRGPANEALRATVSAGCSVLDPADATKEALIRTADVGLFMAKRGGRNRTVAA